MKWVTGRYGSRQQTLDEKARKRAEKESKDMGAKDITGFKRLLVNRYGSVVRAIPATPSPRKAL